MDTIIEVLAQYGVAGVIVAAFMEAIIFPPPVEIILLPVMLSRPENALVYGLITAAASQFGSAAGYLLGRAAGKPLLIRIFGNERIEAVGRIYDKYGAYAIITSAFTPIPYEAYTLSAGAFNMNFHKYAVSTLAGRLIRYVPEGIAVQFLGRAISTPAVLGKAAAAAVIVITVYFIIRLCKV